MTLTPNAVKTSTTQVEPVIEGTKSSDKLSAFCPGTNHSPSPLPPGSGAQDQLSSAEAPASVSSPCHSGDPYAYLEKSAKLFFTFMSIDK